jgi:DNA-binding IscR family transcriptional regulator
LILLFTHFHKGKGLLSFKELQKALHIPAHSLERILEKFKKAQLIYETDTGFLPMKPADQISLLELNLKMPDIWQIALTESEGTNDSPWLMEMRRKWMNLLENNLGERSLSELLEKKA